MFIGACPGSCAGGVKTTTITSLVLLGFSRLRGHDQPRIFYRTISSGSLWRAINVVMTSMLVIVLATMLLLMTELKAVSHLESRGKFLEFFFEVVSAFGTVGLSAGVTGGLSVLGKLIITVVMFIGRLGPLVIGIAISRQRSSRFHYAEENIMVG
jgi:trk system potassium uptake protein TrkH